MVVEPESLCWMTGRMAKSRDGLTWAEEFARFPAFRAVVRDDGTGLGKGVRLERARRRSAGLPELDDTLDVFHTLREGGRALRKTWGAATRALERADASQKELDRLGRQGRSRQGHGTATRRLWDQAERTWGQAAAAETAWKRARSAFEFFTPEGRLNDRAQAEAIVAASWPHLSGQAWAKTRRLLLRRESFTFLEQVQGRLAELGLDADLLSALLDLEGLRRQPWRLSAATRAWASVRTVQLTKACPDCATRPGGLASCSAGCGGRAAWWSASTAWRGCSSAASEDDAGIAGPEATVLEPEAIPRRPPQGPDAVRPAWVKVARVELLGIPRADPEGIAERTVRDER